MLFKKDPPPTTSPFTHQVLLLTPTYYHYQLLSPLHILSHSTSTMSTYQPAARIVSFPSVTHSLATLPNATNVASVSIHYPLSPSGYSQQSEDKVSPPSIHPFVLMLTGPIQPHSFDALSLLRTSPAAPLLPTQW